MNISMDNGKVNINGKCYSGNNISIVNGEIVVDGVTQNDKLTGPINVVVHGDVQILESQSGNVTANNVGEINTGSGDVECNDVSGSIRTGSGDIKCGTVGGPIRTGSGNVYRR